MLTESDGFPENEKRLGKDTRSPECGEGRGHLPSQPNLKGNLFSCG